MKAVLNRHFAMAVLLLCLLLTFNELEAQNSGGLRIKINPVWNGRPLQLGSQYYITENGDSLYIDAFKFYLSAIHVTGKHNNTLAKKNSYHLINAEDTNSLSFTIRDIPANDYTLLSLAIGVDSLTNVSGALDGDLDPVKGMYWAWNTGYINAKTEGRSSACKTLHHAFELHIGGYLSPHHSLRKVVLQLQDLKIARSQTTLIELNADLAEWFKTPATIDISKINSIVIPGKEACMIADNYQDMFNVFKIVNPQ